MGGQTTNRTRIGWTLVLAVPAALLAGLVIGGGMALATHDDPNELHACVKDVSGAMRLVGSPDACRPQEQVVSWAIEGPEGPQGPQGPQGAPAPTDRIEELETKVADLEALLAGVTRGLDRKGLDTLTFSAMNVQIVDGTGDSRCTHLSGGGSEPCNGLGNLIVGYNEDTIATGSPEGEEERTGAHNLIIGDENGWTAYGGVVFGVENYITNGYATITGGLRNRAGGFGSSVGGGAENFATGAFSVVGGGGINNHATGTLSAVIGGSDNEASGFSSAFSACTAPNGCQQ
ncbi:MAG: hypothetical protein OEU32_09580 [Acidimicrobiia bacterium]|nr:hypothetical protein [Acidimicrobiia bacterium]